MGIAPLREATRRLTSRGRVPERLWQRLPVPDPVDVRLPLGGGFRWTGPQWAARRLFWTGLIDEPETLAVWCALARDAAVIVDVGANPGVSALAACATNPSARVLAVEPARDAADLLRTNVDANRWSQRCEVLQLAATNRRGTGLLHVPEPLSP